MFDGMKKLFTQWQGNIRNEYASSWVAKLLSCVHICKNTRTGTSAQTGNRKFLARLSDAEAETFNTHDDSAGRNESDGMQQYRITGQEFLSGETVFIFRESGIDGERRMLSMELYADVGLLEKFCLRDVVNIVHTAVQEQTIRDME